MLIENVNVFKFINSQKSSYEKEKYKVLALIHAIDMTVLHNMDGWMD